MHIFSYVLKEYKDYFVALNVDVSDLGSHGTCKGAVTFCASGCKLAPPVTSICLVVGCSMLNMNSCYLWYEVAGDQLCVRSVSGLKPVTWMGITRSPLPQNNGNLPIPFFGGN